MRENVNQKCYNCRFINSSIIVDGDFEKSIWRKAEAVEFFIPVTSEKPVSKTEAGLLWDESFLYICFKAYDKDIFAYNTEKDSSTYQDDVLEIFLKIDFETEAYYNFEINALNTVYDAYNLRRFAAGGDHRWKRWDCKGLKSIVSIKGTINDPSDIDGYWQLEVAIPFNQLDLGGKKNPEFGDKWSFLLARYDYSIYLEKGLELSSSSYLTNVDFHKYEEWNHIAFVE